MQKYDFAVSFGMSYTPVGLNIPKIPDILLKNFYFRMNIQYPGQNDRIFWVGGNLQARNIKSNS